jgi:hypothetical protein
VIGPSISMEGMIVAEVLMSSSLSYIDSCMNIYYCHIVMHLCDV